MFTKEHYEKVAKVLSGGVLCRELDGVVRLEMVNVNIQSAVANDFTAMFKKDGNPLFEELRFKKAAMCKPKVKM